MRLSRDLESHLGTASRRLIAPAGRDAGRDELPARPLEPASWSGRRLRLAIRGLLSVAVLAGCLGQSCFGPPQSIPADDGSLVDTEDSAPVEQETPGPVDSTDQPAEEPVVDPAPDESPTPADEETEPPQEPDTGYYVPLPATGLVLLAPMSDSPVDVDGKLGPGEWEAVAYDVDSTGKQALGILVDGEPATPEDSSATLYFKHDKDFLYVGVDVTDDTVVGSADWVWEADCLELFLDNDNSRSDGVGLNRVQFVVAAGGDATSAAVHPPGSWYATALPRPGGWTAEFRIAKSVFGLQTSGTYGFDLAISDVEPGPNQIATRYWGFSQEESPGNESHWGSLKLMPAPDATDDPILAVSTNRLDFGKNARELSLDVWNAGGGVLYFDVPYAASWIHVDTTAGQSGGEHQTLTVRADRGQLGLGRHETRLIVDGGTSGLVSVPVVVEVATGLPTVTPEHGWASAGEEGGPFTPTSLSYTLSNTGLTPIGWSATHSQPWVSLSATEGTLPAGGSTTVVVSINALAEDLDVATYSDVITFTNTTTGESNTFRSVYLTVTPLGAGFLTVTPLTGLTATGQQGGPFSPGSQTYTLTNGGESPINWSVDRSQTWVSLSKTEGTLAAGASDTVKASINVIANDLRAGAYSDSLSFLNETNGAGNTSRTVLLNISAPDNPVLSVFPGDGFNSFGQEGGPFYPSSQTYTLTNTGGGTLNWTAAKAQSWVSLSKTSGSLAAGASDTVSVSINSGANTLPAGTRSDTVTFNSSNGTGTTSRGVSLTISSEPGGGGGGSGGPMATASRTSGVAPLAVFFDAVSPGSGVVQPSSGGYAIQHYEWDFGDSGSGVFATTGKSRNRATGYVAAHVYENPGTYRVGLTVTDSAGRTYEYEQQIVVSAFGGTTYYVSSSRGSDSNNGLSENSPFQSWSKATSVMGTNRRVLFRRGDSWSSGSGVTISSAGPGIVGAYGSGSAPVINITGKGAALGLRGSDWRIMDLEFVGPGASSDVAGLEGSSLTRNLILRTTVRRFRVGIAYGWTGASAHAENTIADCVVNNNVINNGYVGGQKIAVLGTRFETPDVSHLLRVWGIRKGVISNNYMNAPGGDRLALKLHNEIALNLPDAQYIVVSDNDMRGHVYVVSIAPQAWDYDERVKDVVFERNTLRSMSDTFNALLVEAQRVTIRNNIFLGDGAGPYYTGMTVGGNAAGADNRIYNNTVYRSQSGREFTAVSAGGADIRNNLASAPGTPGASFGSGTSHNLLTNNPQFSNAAAGDFSLLSGSPARNAGTPTAYVRDSSYGVSRPQGGAYDIGATEQ